MGLRLVPFAVPFRISAPGGCRGACACRQRLLRCRRRRRRVGGAVFRRPVPMFVCVSSIAALPGDIVRQSRGRTLDRVSMSGTRRRCLAYRRPRRAPMGPESHASCAMWGLSPPAYGYDPFTDTTLSTFSQMSTRTSKYTLRSPRIRITGWRCRQVFVCCDNGNRSNF